MYNICMNEISFEWDENKNSINKENLGMSYSGKVLMVVHCIREESVIRIISSRKATDNERKGYERSKGL